MKKTLYLKICLCICFLLLGCQKNHVTIDISLKEQAYTIEKISLPDKDGIIVATKKYDMEKDTETSEFTFYIKDAALRNEFFISWSENYLVQFENSDAQCLEYLFYEVFHFSDDKFLNEAIQPFEAITSFDEMMIEKRREYEQYDGWLCIAVSSLKKDINPYTETSYEVKQGKLNSVIYESKVYEIEV